MTTYHQYWSIQPQYKTTYQASSSIFINIKVFWLFAIQFNSKLHIHLMNFHPGQNSQDKEFSKNCHWQIKSNIFHFLSKITTEQKPKYLPSFSTFITKVSQSNFPSLSIVTIQNFNSVFLKWKMQIQMQTCFIKKYLNFPQKDMINLRNFVPFKLKFHCQ